MKLRNPDQSIRCIAILHQIIWLNEPYPANIARSLGFDSYAQIRDYVDSMIEAGWVKKTGVEGARKRNLKINPSAIWEDTPLQEELLYLVGGWDEEVEEEFQTALNDILYRSIQESVTVLSDNEYWSREERSEVAKAHEKEDYEPNPSPPDTSKEGVYWGVVEDTNIFVQADITIQQLLHQVYGAIMAEAHTIDSRPLREGQDEREKVEPEISLGEPDPVAVTASKLFNRYVYGGYAGNEQ